MILLKATVQGHTSRAKPGWASGSALVGIKPQHKALLAAALQTQPTFTENNIFLLFYFWFILSS
jgi:hypothetical protein